MAAEDSRV